MYLGQDINYEKYIMPGALVQYIITDTVIYLMLYNSLSVF